LLLYYSSLAPGHRHSPANNILFELKQHGTAPGPARSGQGRPRCPARPSAHRRGQVAPAGWHTPGGDRDVDVSQRSGRTAGDRRAQGHKQFRQGRCRRPGDGWIVCGFRLHGIQIRSPLRSTWDRGCLRRSGTEMSFQSRGAARDGRGRLRRNTAAVGRGRSSPAACRASLLTLKPVYRASRAARRRVCAVVRLGWRAGDHQLHGNPLRSHSIVSPR